MMSTQNNSLSSSNALVALATVTNSEGEPQADLLLTFSLSNDDLATFSNDTATALTNAEGVASIGMSVGRWWACRTQPPSRVAGQ